MRAGGETGGTAPHASDAELLAAIARGEDGALHELYRRHAPTLLARLSARCADATLVDEAVQETFVAVWRRPTAWRGDGPVAAWLWGIGIRRLLDVLSRRPRVRILERPAPIPSAEDVALAHALHGDLALALGDLSPELLAVIQATVLDGLTTRETARLLGLPVGTVKTRAMRARQQLREVLT